jgi:hypothetical protein
MLLETQARLERHFDALSRERLPHHFPVYAIEHGLESAEIDTIRRALCDELVAARHLIERHWLLWIVVAAEIGYTYDGDEYWMSFEAEISGWHDYGSRDTVRDWFKTFAKRFSGFTPAGRWAEHFSIIAWPITHSILPRYLQAQFARHLYELRHDLAETSYTGIDKLGELLNERYDGHSSRFENFLQQTALTGRLVLAMRDEDVQDAIAPISRPTLARIIADLEQKSASRGYLRDARRVLREARLKARSGLGIARGPAAAGGGLAPPRGMRLIAKRSSDGSWGVGVAMPDAAALLKQHGLGVSLLDRHRMRFADRPGGWMPGRALLSYAGREHILSRFPESPATPIVELEGAKPEARPFLDDMKLSRRSPWLLRVHEDGVAREVLGNHVRIGEAYLIATDAPVAPELAAALKLEAAACRTAGLALYLLGPPKSAAPQFVQALGKLGFGYALRAKVAPVGLVPRWDAAGGGSIWLPHEEILLRISADFDVAEYTVSRNAEPPTHFTREDTEALIVSLGKLPLGWHRVEIGATPKKGATLTVSPETIIVEVRPPLPWQTAIAGRAGIRAIVEPANARLEALIEGKAVVTLHGSAERTATVDVRLFGASGHLSEGMEIGRLTLPASPKAMADCVQKLSKEPLSEKLHSAARVELAFALEELGVAVLTFDHKIQPLRWKLEGAGGRRMVRLIDETGAAQAVLVDRFGLCAPDKRVELQPQACLGGVAVEPPGALFAARYNGKRYAAVASVPPAGPVHTFADLSFPIAFATPEGSPRSIMRLLAVLRLWQRSRMMGPLASVRRARVIGALERRIKQAACGASWADRAARFAEGRGVTIEELQREVGGSPGFASRMRSTRWKWYPDSTEARKEFCHYAKFYGVSEDAELCKLALRLAFHPASIRFDDPTKGAEIFKRLGETPVLARGAFFAKLASDAQSETETETLAEAG